MAGAVLSGAVAGVCAVASVCAVAGAVLPGAVAGAVLPGAVAGAVLPGAVAGACAGRRRGVAGLQKGLQLSPAQHPG